MGASTPFPALQHQKQPEPAIAPPREVASGRLARLITATLFAWVALDVIPRFLPVEWLHILPEHVAARRPGKFYPFIPNLKVHYDPWVSPTAIKGNLAPTEKRTPLDFSTDSMGFRLTPGVPPGGRVDFLLFSGSSFAYGSGLSDDETFPAQFTRDSGLRMYNGGHFWWDLQDLAALDWLVGQFPGQHPVVVLLAWEQMNHRISDLETAHWKIDRAGQSLLGAERYRQIRLDVQYAKRYANAIWTISPLEILSIRFFKRLANDEILPNRYRPSVVPFETSRGDRILFLEEEVRRVQHPPTDEFVAGQAAYFAHFEKRLAERNLGIYVVLIPNRYTLYGRFVDPAAPKGPRYLDRLEAALRRQGTPVVNGLSALEPYAAGDVASGDFCMYREDHHWTPKGVHIVAQAFEAQLRADGMGNGGPLLHAVQ